MNVLLKQREVAFYLGDPEAKLVFAWHEFAEPARAGAAQADAECVIVAPGEFEQYRLRSYAASRRRLAARCSKATGCLRPPRSRR